MRRKKVVTFSQIIYKKLLTYAIVSATIVLKIRIVLIRKEYRTMTKMVELIRHQGGEARSHGLFRTEDDAITKIGELTEAHKWLRNLKVRWELKYWVVSDAQIENGQWKIFW